MTMQAPSVTVQDHTIPDMDNGELLKKLDRIGRLAAAGKWKRLVHSPFKYMYGIFSREILYRNTKKSKDALATLFWGDKIKIRLPASMDLYLLGCKTHDSEIRLTRFFLKNLHKRDHFLDIGAHVGFYSLLASLCVGEKGKVLSIEASPESFSLLDQNTFRKNNIEALNMALSDLEETIPFFEFPGMYAEFNTIDIHPFENQPWFRNAKVDKVLVKAMPGDSVIEKYRIRPGMIKIDVEGAENKVVKGLKTFLMQHDPFVAMEFVSKKRDNHNHVLADQQLTGLGYTAYSILPDGALERISEAVDDHVDKKGLESDNIIYKKLIF